MSSDYFSINRTRLLKSRTRDEAFKELISLVDAEAHGIDRNQIFNLVQEREATISTRLLPEIAIPHALIPGFKSTQAAVGFIPDGIDYDPNDATKVRLIILIVGDGLEHLKVLALVAERLNDPERVEELLKARSIKKVYNLLNGIPIIARSGKLTVTQRTASRLLEKACELASELNVAAIVYHDVTEGIPPVNISKIRCAFYLVCPDLSLYPKKMPGVTEILQLPFGNVNRTSQAELVLIYLISRGLLKKNSSIISVLGEPGSGKIDALLISDTSRFELFFQTGTESRPLDIEHHVLARIIQIAGELAAEGREGKPVGTLFILGNSDAVLQSCQQMVVNPFGGYREENRNILDPGLEATIKEFSKIDGAFIIRGDGVILTSGVFLKAENNQDPLLKGYGARHTAAVNISYATGAIAVALSESTRRVSVFKGGKRILYF
ncbi:MAG TPA: PTS sugar transporter subunit IIA [Chitinispirillaceae bacterium]|nr:PTS sugar transporter subunit IIA [Chitinispirillaceae bacterium]